MSKTVAGFTLIELIITIGVFTVGVLGAFSLALANSNNNRANKDRIIAANLAREALELTRNIRDSNWLRMDSNLSCDGGATICSWDDRSLEQDFILLDYNTRSEGEAICSGAFDLDACMNNATNGCKLDGTCRMHIDSDGFYSHDDTGIATNFFRVVSLLPICLDDSGPLPLDDVGCLGSGEEQIGIEATVRIDWNRAGKEYSLELSDRFYNWRR